MGNAKSWWGNANSRPPYNLSTGYYYYRNWPKMCESVHNRYTAWPRRVARISQRGGLFWEVKTTINELDPNFHLSWIRLRRFFCQNQVISKKKVFTKIETVFPAEIRWSPKKERKVFIKIQSLLLTNFGWAPENKKIHMSGPNNNKSFITASPSQLLLPIPVGGLFSFLAQKSASKALNTCYFAYFSG